MTHSPRDLISYGQNSAFEAFLGKAKRGAVADFLGDSGFLARFQP
jgi:hypothetical protein